MNELIVFGEDWGRHPSSSQHLIEHLQPYFHIIWINSIGLRHPTCNRTDIQRLWEKLLATSSKKKQTNPPPFTIIHPKIWPLPNNTTVLKFNQWQLQKKIPAKKNTRLVWCALPSAIDYLPNLQADKIIYYCGDDFNHLAGVDHQTIHRLEKRLCQQADLILCASKSLLKKLDHCNAHYLPHGVDLKHFSLERQRSEQPTIGFYGSLNTWLDTDLILYLATQRPYIQFVLIGREDTNLTALTKQKNIQILPPCSHQELPKHLSRWDAAILPFLNNGQIHACNPLKLREYLASGCYVISSVFPSAMEYAQYLHLAQTPQEWLNAIDQCHQKSLKMRQEHHQHCQQRLQKESWQHRVKELLQLLNQ